MDSNGRPRIIFIELGGKRRKLAFDTTSVRLATSSLQQFLPQGSAKLKQSDAGNLIMQGDLDAIIIFLTFGLGDMELKPLTVNDWYTAELAKESTIEGKERRAQEITHTLLDALEASGLVVRRIKSTDAVEDVEDPTRAGRAAGD